MTTMRERLEGMIDGPRDGAMLRHSLGIALMQEGDTAAAIDRFSEALAFDPDYSAAWKALGKALSEGGRQAEALDAYRKGIEVATGRGDLQAAKEMTVFARRLEKAGRPAG
ncbi:MAG: tetratricopeptide repeat protein [Rhodocyclaceae bacterium]|nr:tetratricopeptide repeat protein [Rhodocyclaceae bacterium]